MPVSQPGDLWLLGRHRLLCGSATDPADVARLLGGVRPHLMVTDPPYGVSYDPAWRNRAGAVGDQAHRQGAERRPGRLARGLGAVPRRGRLRLARGAARHHRRREPRSPAASRSAARSSGPRSGWCSRRGDYHWQHEPCWYAVREKGKGHWNGDRKQTTLWSDPEPRPGRGDGARHPEAGRGDAPADAEQQRARASRSTSRSPDRGPRIIAAETCGRISLSMELDPAYVDVAVDPLAGLHRRGRDPRRRRPQLRRDRRREGRPMSAAAARSRRRSAGSRATAASGPGTTTSRSRPTRCRAAPSTWRRSPAGRVAPGRAHPARHGGADHDRPRRARRLLPGLRPLGRGRAAS